MTKTNRDSTKNKTIFNLAKSIAGLVGFLIVMVVLAFGLYTILASRDQETRPGSQYLPTTTTTVSQANLTTDWKVHKDAERGFIVKFPPSWHLDSPGPGSLWGVTTITSYDLYEVSAHRTLTNSDLEISLYWAYEDRPATLSVSGWVQKNATEAMMSITSSSEVQIGNKSVLYVTARDDSPQGQGDPLNIYYIPHGNQVFVVNAKPADSTHLPTLELIITTLELTD